MTWSLIISAVDVGYSRALMDSQITRRVPVYVIDSGVDRSHEVNI